MDEEILGFVDGVKYGSGPAWSKKAAKTYQLFFTSNRAIAAKTGGGFLKSLSLTGGLVGVGLLDAFKDKEKAEELSKLSPDEVKASDEVNFDIPYSDVVKVEVKKPGLFNPVGSIIIHTTAKKFQFNQQSASKEIFVRYIELINAALPGKYVGK